jgi:tungstate transport system ATP-binding protein
MSLRLQTRNITKSYDGRRVISDCSVTYEQSGIHVVMGPNGCGKSTFLRICALLEKPDAGEVRFTASGETLDNDIDLKRRITLVLPSVGVFNTSVYKNVAYGLMIRGLSREVIREKTESVLEFVGLITKKSHNARTLSSGEKQRLGIARAIIIDPEILFLDEPAAYIDQENTEIVEEIILDMKKYRKKTVIMTTHQIEQGKRLADSILVMRDGKIIERGNMPK